MFTEADIKQIEERGSILEAVHTQIENFKSGFPFMKLESSAYPGAGVIALSEDEISKLISDYDESAKQKHILKFVPASGAASRMFKLLFSFLEIADDPEKVKAEFDKSDGLQSIKNFFDRINDFAFKDDINEVLNAQGKSIRSCMDSEDYASIISALLNTDGLDYGSLPKGLLKFHKYEDGCRTPLMEHLVEGALYARSKDDHVNLHFTVSNEHRERFETHLAEVKGIFEKMYSVTINVSFSEQKPYTDTIAVDLDNEPFRNQDGTLLFRPAGHGALIANLNDIDADLIFIKNIDNVVPDKIKHDTVKYKKTLAGMLLKYQEKIFCYLTKLDGEVTDDLINEILEFIEKELLIKDLPSFISQEEAVGFIKAILNRPIRTCGIVKNEGEPGGGPFYIKNNDGTQSLQIVEPPQIDRSDAAQKAIADGASHFSPTDLVCAVRNYKGDKFDLTKHVDPTTGFISQKSKDGKELKAQELPGLWNGSMSNWTTIFVEVSVTTFNPVKTVNDLLRPQHQ